MRKLSDIIDEYIIQEGYDTRHNFDRFMSLGMRCLKEMNYDISGKPSFKLLEVETNSSACVPSGVVKVLGLYMYSRQGLVPIMETDRLNPSTFSDGETVPPVVPDQSAEYPTFFETGMTTDGFAARFRRGEFVGHEFSGQAYPYTYIRNYDINRFEFSSNVASPVVMKALFNPSALDGNFYVDAFDENAILLYLRYIDLRSKPSTPMNEKLLAKQEYLGARMQARKRQYAKDPREIAMAFRNNYGLNPT